MTTEPITTAPAPAPAAAETAEVKVGDQTLKVPTAVAAALTEARKAAEDAGVAAREIEQKLTAQLDELRKQVPAKAPTTPDPSEDVDTKLFTNPKETLNRVKEETKAEMWAAIQQSEAQKVFWTDFYDAFPELKGDDLVVKAVLNRDFADLKPLKVADAIQKLGENTQKYLLERGVKREKVKKGAEVEGGTEKGSPGQKKAKGEPSLTPANSLTAVLKERQQKRRAAAGGAAAS